MTMRKPIAILSIIVSLGLTACGSTTSSVDSSASASSDSVVSSSSTTSETASSEEAVSEISSSTEAVSAVSVSDTSAAVTSESATSVPVTSSSEISVSGSASSEISSSDQSLQALRESLTEEGYAGAVMYLGTYDGELTEEGFQERFSDAVTEYPFMTDAITDQRVVDTEGLSVFFFIPADESDTVEVDSVLLGEDGNMDPVDQLYSSSGSPVLIRCMVADFYADVNVILSSSDGEELGEFMPYLSGKDGSVVIEEDSGNPVFRDLTDYDNLIQ